MKSPQKARFSTLEVTPEQLPERVTRLKLSGELDISSYNEFLPELDEFVDKTARALIVDMEDLCFMDGSGVKLLISFGSQFGFENVVIYKASRNILRVLRIISFSQKFVYLASDREFEDWRNNLNPAA